MGPPGAMGQQSLGDHGGVLHPDLQAAGGHLQGPGELRRGRRPELGWKSRGWLLRKAGRKEDSKGPWLSTHQICLWFLSL